MARPKNCNKCNKPKRPRGKKFKDAEGYCMCGRPTVMTPDVIAKLEAAFTNAFSDEQACAYANISVDALYDYQKENPEFTKRKQQLKLRPDITAKQTIVNNLGTPSDAWRWLERRDPEFRPTTKVEHGGAVELIEGEIVMSEDERVALEALRTARRKRIEAEARTNAKTTK